MNATINRIRGALRLLGPDHITPMGVRILEKILDEEESMKNVRIQVATLVEDLDVGSLPVGTRFATNHNKILELDEITDKGRKDTGKRFWIEPMTLQPLPVAMDHWLPAFILPAPVGSSE
jgi:hypothetical protein